MALRRAPRQCSDRSDGTHSIHACGSQNVGIFNPDAQGIIYSPDVLDNTALIEVPLPRPRPPLRDIITENSVALISAFRQQHGRGLVAISGVLTRIAQEQANAMAARDLLVRRRLDPARHEAVTRSVHSAMNWPLVSASTPPLILFLRSEGMALRAHASPFS
jgi:hypothetical protein